LRYPFGNQQNTFSNLVELRSKPASHRMILNQAAEFLSLEHTSPPQVAVNAIIRKVGPGSPECLHPINLIR
jgi:hypothetical protein